MNEFSKHSPRLKRNRNHSKNPFQIHSIRDFFYKAQGKKMLMKKIIGIALIAIVLGGILIWGVFLRGLPSIEKLASGDYFRESTIIYDKDGGVIYSLFKDGKRTYIEYPDISQSIKDAIISTEDRTFFENPGIDLMGLMRVGATYITGGKFGSTGGASTISQQLIKNTLLTNERSIKRKIQEAYLSYQMNKKYSKEKILEMYLNAFSFGYNANGVEEASRTYFGKSAKEVGPLGATILASLPKGPTYYSPYLHRDRLMGKIEVYPTHDSENRKTLQNAEDRKGYEPLYNGLRLYLSGMTIDRNTSGITACGISKDSIKGGYSPDKEGCINLSFDQVLDFFGNIIITKDLTLGGHTESYTIEYSIGRKDFVANQMLEDGKIDGTTFKKIIYDGLDFEFKKYSENIKFPYFVMYVKEYLESKYGKDIDVTNGLKVYTTIDPKLQAFAEEAVKKQVAINKVQYGANSAALVSMDNTTGKLLAMVGGPDYFDEENGGNNNMATANRQPGSSFKPIVYSLAIAKNPIGSATPITDSRLKFGKWEPDNYDLGFKGIMTLESALAYSRNIPAIKMYYLAGQEEAIVKYARGLGIQSLRENFGYGAPLALGTGEAKPIEMMQAYSVFANNGVKKTLHFIEKIEDNEGNMIEEYKNTAGEEVMNPSAAYIIAKILSNNDARPESSFWRNALSISGRSVAAKTGTSNMEVGKGENKKILPRDLWTAGFSPQITTVVWAGNVDGKATKSTCDGLNCAAAIWKSYMNFALSSLPKEEFTKPEGIHSYSISKLTGLLATKETPEDLVRTTLMATELKTYDGGLEEMELDSLCYGPVTEETPTDARIQLYVPTTKPIIDGYDPEWLSGFRMYSQKYTSGSGTIETSKDPCVRPKDSGVVTISAIPVGLSKDNLIEISWNGNRILKKIQILDTAGKVIKEVDFAGSGTTSGNTRMNLGKIYDITIKGIDTYGYMYTQKVGGQEVSNSGSLIDGSQKKSPNITMINPKSGSLNLYIGDTFNLRFQVEVGTTTREVSVSIDGKEVQNATSGDLFVFPMSSAGLTAGKHITKIKVTDANFQAFEKTFTLNILPR